MTKNCCTPVPSEQKKLLKVLTCLFDNYIANKTPSTVAYFANPSGDVNGSDTYDPMVQELDAIVTLINNYLNANGLLFDGSAIPVANIWVATAEGKVAFNSDASNNTFVNAISPFPLGIQVNGVYSEVSGFKTVQKLNIDDCASRTHQVTPVVVIGGDLLPTNVTQASLVERVGCSGVSNLGFICLNLQVPIASAPFNTCTSTNCC